jgi:DNA polymerase III subunit delta'
VPSLAGIVGHRRLTTLLSQAIARDTLPPTLLFSGPTGVGKYLVAKALASTVNCLAPARDRGVLALDACGMCRSCDRIERDVHVDVLVLTPDERASIKIEVVRDMLERTSFRPFEGRRRVVIIRDADALEPAAQNSLLKSLEEPPESTVFVLSSAVPGALLPTVRSRCMRLQFGRLTEREVADVLVREHDMGEREALEAAALSDGRIGEALALGSTDVAVLRESALLLLRQAAANGSAQSRLQAAGVLASGPAKKERPREDVALVLRMMASMLRDIELLNTGGDTRALANAVIADDIAALTRGYGGARARDAFAAVDRAITALERNAGTKVVSEWLALQL